MSTAIATPGQDLQHIANMLAMQQQCVQTAKYEYLGRIWKIVLGDSKDAPRGEKRVVDMLGKCLDFYQEANKGRPIGPRIAQAPDKQSLLLLDQIRRADGTVGLPLIPDPTWIPPVHIPTKAEQRGGVGAPVYTPPKPPFIEQPLADRARGMFPPGKREFLLFGPVEQILILPDGLAETWIAFGQADHNGRHLEMLISPTTGQAHFVYGQYQISRYR